MKMSAGLSVVGVTIVAAGVIFILGAEKPGKTELRIGVFDSRAVAVAYANSAFGDNLMAKKMAEKHQAEKDGDAEKVRELGKWGDEYQWKRHSQAFSTAPVHDLLECVKERIPSAAKQSGVDIVVSKWELVYQSPQAEVIDITDDLVKLYKPNDRGLKWIEQMKTIKPMSEEELKKSEREHPH